MKELDRSMLCLQCGSSKHLTRQCYMNAEEGSCKDKTSWTCQRCGTRYRQHPQREIRKCALPNVVPNAVRMYEEFRLYFV